LDEALEGKEYLVGNKCTVHDLSFIAWDMVRFFLIIIELSHVEEQGAWELSQELACSFVFLSAFETPSRLPNVWSNYSANTLEGWFHGFSAIELVSLNIK
jgi:glycopeptide antibiotics resistance protein